MISLLRYKINQLKGGNSHLKIKKLFPLKFVFYILFILLILNLDTFAESLLTWFPIHYIVCLHSIVNVVTELLIVILDLSRFLESNIYISNLSLVMIFFFFFLVASS